MNSNEKPHSIWTPVWPTRRNALLRLLLIIIILLPFWWAVYALLVGDWQLNFPANGKEPWRHLVEGILILIGFVAVVFLTSLLPVFGWLFNRRNARRLFIAALWFVTLAVLFYAEENWRGARAWQKYRQQIEAQGAQLDLAAFNPKPVSDEHNFAATPLIKSWFVRTNYQWNDNFSRVHGRILSETNASKAREFTDLVAFEIAFAALRSGETKASFQSGKLDSESRSNAAPAILEALKDDEAVFAELRVVSERPRSVYPVFYDMENPWGILLPHLAKVKGVCARLRLKACAELAAGKTDDALADIKLIIRMTDSVTEEPFLISYLVRLVCVQFATQPVWEGLAEHRWSDAQLQELQKQFAKFDFIADLKRPLEAERAAGVLTSDLIRKRGLGLLSELLDFGHTTSGDKKFANWIGGLLPRGWFDLERVNYYRLYRVQLEGAFDPTKKRVWPERVQAGMKELEREFSGGMFGVKISGFLRHRYLSTILLPALSKIPEKAASAQVSVDHAAIACALERYRLANGDFPQKFDALVPKFISQLPSDVHTGEPYNYHRTDNQFVLSSVGWNQKPLERTPRTVFDVKTGERVWQYPQK